MVVDQTLYWRWVATEEEAWYRVGFMNTDAITDLVSEFNPEGEFGERHLHTLPNRVLPIFDLSNPEHIAISGTAKRLSVLAAPLIAADRLISNPAASLSVRRRRLRLELKKLQEYEQLEAACSALLATQEFPVKA